MAGPRILLPGERVGTPQIGVAGGQIDVPAPSQVGNSLTRLGQSGEALLETLAENKRLKKAEEDRQAEEDAKAFAAKAVPQMTLDLDKMDTDARANAQPGAVGYSDGLAKQVDGYLAQAEKNAPTPQAKKYIAEHGAAMRAQVLGKAYAYEVGERQAQRVSEFQSANAIAANAVGADPSRYAMLHDQQAAMIDALDAPPEVKRDLKKANDRDLSTAAVLADAERDPLAMEAQIRHRLGLVNADPAPGAPVGADANIDAVLRTEGGYVANDAGKGPTNFGINSSANPDIPDVSKLTADQARTIYKTRYWDAIGADRLPANIQALAFDAAVNQGVGKARQMLEESGGDPVKFAAIRKREYTDLAQRDPSKAKNLDGWLARVDRLTGPPAPGTPQETGNPALDKLDTQQTLTLLGRVQAERERQNQDFRTFVTSRVQDDSAAALDGKPSPNPLTQADFERAYGKDGQTNYAAYAARQAVGAKLPALATLTPEQLAEQVKAAEPQPGEGYAAASQNYDTLVKAAAQVQAERTADPMAFAIKHQLGVKPLDPNGDMREQLRARQSSARALSDKYGVRYSLLSNQETAVFGQKLQAATPEEKVQVLQQFRGALDDEGYRAIVGAIAPTQPLTASAAAFLGMPNRAVAGMNGAQVGARILAGQELLSPAKGGTKVDLAADSKLREAFNTQVGDAYRGQANAQERAFGAFRAYYAATANMKGTINAADVDTDLVGEAVQAVTGGIAQVNDRATVLPWGVSEEKFTDLAQSYWPRALLLSGVSPTTPFGRASFAPAGGDRYYVMVGDTPLHRTDGKGLVTMQVNLPEHATPATGMNSLADSYGASGF